MKKRLLTTITFFFTGIAFGSLVSAQVSFVPKTSFDLEPPLEEQNESYFPAESIIVTPLSIKTDNFISPEDWYEGIYYYQAFRLNQHDFLFHYLVTDDGRVFEGNSLGEEQRFNINESEENPVVIAYLSAKDEFDFSSQSKSVIADLVLDIANRNAIPLEKIKAVDMEFVAREGEAIFSRTSDLSGRWKRTMTDIVESIRGRYRPVKREFKFKVESVQLPSGKVKYGDNVIAKIIIKNISKFTYYQGSDTDPLISKVSGDSSLFFVNDVWVSRTQAPLKAENVVMKPGETHEYQVRLGVPLYFDKQTETFELINSFGDPFPGTRFQITLDIKRPSQEVVEITQTETGQLNVRQEPNGFSDIVFRVTPGQRFFVLNRTDSGWVQLDLGSSRKGWVSRQYTIKVN